MGESTRFNRSIFAQPVFQWATSGATPSSFDNKLVITYLLYFKLKKRILYCFAFVAYDMCRNDNFFCKISKYTERPLI